MVPLLLALACRPDADVVTPEPLPWEGLTATDLASGAFEAEIGETFPGAGWFHTDDDERWGAEGAFARIERPDGATEDVLGITIVGRTREDGWTTLQLDVALSGWWDGDVEIDGGGAVGVLRSHVGGEATLLAYVVGGVLDVDDAGDEDGETVSGDFTDLTLREVAP